MLYYGYYSTDDFALRAAILASVRDLRDFSGAFGCGTSRRLLFI